jgi:cytochrome d ubiquinol oxidase subunit II
MVYVVMAYLWAAILLYLLMGGADFGAGIIELFTSGNNKSKTRRTMYHAIGPIWEANHMWLIIAIVILFVGFPVIYTTMSVHLHIPLAIMLLGIIARGTAFAFRNYDAVVDNMQKVYNKIFVYSSFITPLFLGIIAGSAVSGKIDVHAANFADAYIFSWLNWFSVAVGFFTVSICGYLAAIFIIGETDTEDDRIRFIRKIKHMNIAAVITGTLVFTAAFFEGIPLFEWKCRGQGCHHRCLTFINSLMVIITQGKDQSIARAGGVPGNDDTGNGNRQALPEYHNSQRRRVSFAAGICRS